MPGVRQVVQPELQPHHAQPEAHGIQALRLRPVRQRLPEESGPEEAQRDAARAEVTRTVRTHDVIMLSDFSIFESLFSKGVRDI